MSRTYLDATCAESGLEPPWSQLSSLEMRRARGKWRRKDKYDLEIFVYVYMTSKKEEKEKRRKEKKKEEEKIAENVHFVFSSPD